MWTVLDSNFPFDNCAGSDTYLASDRMPKAIYFGELYEGPCNRDAPRKRYKDQLRCHFAPTGIEDSSWQRVTSERDEWRALIKVVGRTFEDRRRSRKQNN